MNTTRYQDHIANINRHLTPLRSGIPDVMQGFSAMARAAMAPGALDEKTKELIAMAIAVAVRCDGCIGFHAKAAIGAGASRQEILETLSMAIYMGAGPSMIYAAEALRAYDELSPTPGAST